MTSIRYLFNLLLVNNDGDRAEKHVLIRFRT